MKGADEFMVEEVEAMQAGVQARRMELFGRCGGANKGAGVGDYSDG